MVGRPRKGPQYRAVHGFQNKERLKLLLDGKWEAYFDTWTDVMSDRIMSSMALLPMTGREEQEWQAELAAEEEEALDTD